MVGLLFSQSTQNPVTITASVESPARAGEVVNIKINADMEDQWHIYSIYKLTEGPLPTEITVNSSVVGAMAPVQEPKPKYVFDSGFETDTYYHKGNTEFIFPVRIKRSAQPGDYSMAVDVYYMVCNERLCYPPITKSDTVRITIEAGSPRNDRTTFVVASTGSGSGTSAKAPAIIVADVENPAELHKTLTT